jgi:hypothetical protein
VVDDKAFERAQREVAKRLGLKKYKQYPAEPLRILLSDPERREDLERAYRDEEEWEGFLPFARLVLQVWESAGPPESFSESGRVSEQAVKQLGANATNRSQAFSEGLARLASSDSIVGQDPDKPSSTRRVPSEVKRFRVKYLDDKLLSSQQAWELLASPVAALKDSLWFTIRGVPIVGHGYRVTEGLSKGKRPYSLVEVTLPGSKRQSFKDRRPLRAGVWELPEKQENARSNEKPMRELKTTDGTWRILPYPGAGEHTHRVLVWPNSVLSNLHDTVSRLIQRYPWEEQDAVWFVLTGTPPWVVPFTWQARWFGDGIGEDSFRYGFVTLKVEPWVDPKLVWKMYSDIQRGLRGGRRTRRLEQKTLDLLRFVDERVNVADLSRAERRKQAPALVAAWDKERPDDSFEGNTKEFWKAYHRARQAVMSPTYEWRGKN